MALYHLGSVKACLAVLGSAWVSSNFGFCLGKEMPDFALVCMGCVLAGLIGKMLSEVVVWGGGDGFVMSGKGIGGVFIV
jgi:hypothetical protein